MTTQRDVRPRTSKIQEQEKMRGCVQKNMATKKKIKKGNKTRKRMQCAVGWVSFSLDEALCVAHLLGVD